MTVGEFLQFLADRLLEGNLEATAKCYSHPLIIYQGSGEPRIEETPMDTMAALAGRRAGVISAGTNRIVVELEQSREMEDGRVHAIVVRQFLDRDDIVLRQSRLGYFCRPSGDGWKVEMIELIDLGFPLIQLSKGPTGQKQ